MCTGTLIYNVTNGNVGMPVLVVDSSYGVAKKSRFLELPSDDICRSCMKLPVHSFTFCQPVLPQFTLLTTPPLHCTLKAFCLPMTVATMLKVSRCTEGIRTSLLYPLVWMIWIFLSTLFAESTSTYIKQMQSTMGFCSLYLVANLSMLLH